MTLSHISNITYFLLASVRTSTYHTVVKQYEKPKPLKGGDGNLRVLISSEEPKMPIQGSQEWWAFGFKARNLSDRRDMARSVLT